MSFEIVINHPWIAIAACTVAGAMSAYLLYVGQAAKRYSRKQKIALGGLRFISVSTACLLLFAPVLKLENAVPVKPIIGIAIDQSQSLILGKDSTYARDGLSKDIDQFEQGLGTRYRVVRMNGQNPVKFDHKTTDLSRYLKDFQNRYTGQNIAGMVLISDGIHNSGPAINPEPSEIYFPLYTIGVGDTSVQRDVLVESIQTNSIAYVGNEFPVEFMVKGVKVDQTSIPIQVYDNGKLIFQDRFVVQGNAKSYKKTIYSKADSIGIHQIEVRLGKLNDEQNTLNNVRKAFVEVMDKQQKVLIVAHSPHPDIGAIKRSLEYGDVSDIDVVYSLDRTYELTDYDLIITHQLPATNQEYNFLESVAKGKTPNLLIVGMQTRIDLFNKLNIGPAITGNSGNHNYVQAAVNNQFSNFALSDDIQQLLAQAPPLIAPFGDFKSKAASGVLAFQKIGRVTSELPLILNTLDNDRRVGVIYGEGIWRWAFTSQEDEAIEDHPFQNFLRKEVQYLAVKVDRRRFKCTVGKSAVYENEGLELFSEFYNAAYEPITDGQVTYTFKHQDGTVYSFDLTYSNGKYSRVVNGLPAGKYTILAEARFKEEVLTCSNFVQVNEVVLEQLNLTANHDYLQQIAQRTNGSFHSKSGWQKLTENLMERTDVHTIEKRKLSLEDMINLKFLFLMLFLTLAGEWFIRRFSGDY